MRSLALLPAALAVLVLAGCSVGDDGPQRTETRDLDAFTRVDNQDSVDVRLTVGEPQRVRVTAGEKVIGDVRTEVRDGVLEVQFDHDGFWEDDVVVEASVPELVGVRADGSGDIDARGIDAGAFEARADGSGDLSLEGTVTRLALTVDGSGNADLERLAASAADVLVDGSGDAEIRAIDRLDVKVDGSGDVRYHGDPVLNQIVDGSGDLESAQ